MENDEKKKQGKQRKGRREEKEVEWEWEKRERGWKGQEDWMEGKRDSRPIIYHIISEIYSAPITKRT